MPDDNNVALVWGWLRCAKNESDSATLGNAALE